MATVAVIGRVLFVNMFLEPTFGTEYAVAVFTLMPVISLLVHQSKLAGMGGPSSVTPATFNFIGMGIAIVEVLPDPVVIE